MGKKEEHLRAVEETNQTMDKTGIRLKTEKCKIASDELNCLEYRVSAEGLKLLEEKVLALTDRFRPKRLNFSDHSWVSLIN